MQITNKISKPATVHPSDYVNKETGETMDSECKDNVKLSVREGTDLFTVSTNNYIVFDADAMAYMQSTLAKTDVSRVFTMTGMLRTDCSVLYQSNNHPHNSSTLPVVLNMSQDKFYKMVRRLVSKGILAYAVCAPAGYTQKIYMLNPYIARKRKTFNNELNTWFRDITKPIPVDNGRKAALNGIVSEPDNNYGYQEPVQEPI